MKGAFTGAGVGVGGEELVELVVHLFIYNITYKLAYTLLCMHVARARADAIHYIVITLVRTNLVSIQSTFCGYDLSVLTVVQTI